MSSFFVECDATGQIGNGPKFRFEPTNVIHLEGQLSMTPAL